jgi:hypothetical protein
MTEFSVTLMLWACVMLGFCISVEEIEYRNFFRPVFSHFSEKLVAVRPPILSGQKYFFPACFVLFGRKIGHLATVVKNPTHLLPKVSPPE